MASYANAGGIQTRSDAIEGWRVLAVAAFGLFLSMGTIVVLSFGVYLKPLSADLHAGRAAISLAFTIQAIATTLCTPLLGRVIDRFGARVVVLAGTALFGIALVSSKLVGGNVAALYVLFAMLGIVGSTTSPVPYGVIVSRWFDRRRGLALGLMASGLGLGAIFIPLVSQRLIAGIGWRNAYAVFGVATLLLVLPMAARYLAQSPSRRVSSRAMAPGTGALINDFTDGLPWGKIYRERTFWSLNCAYFFAAFSLFGCVVHLPAMISDRGGSAASGATVSALIGVALLAGRFGTGLLLDRFFAPKLAMLVFGGAAVGICLLLTTAGPVIFAVACLLGLAMGAEVDIIAFMMSRYFGLRALGTAFASGFASYVLAGALGVDLMGAGFDAGHSYTLPLAGCAVSMLAAIAFLSQLGPYRYQPSGSVL